MAGADEGIAIDPEGLARAERALALLSERYLHWAMADIRGLETALTDARGDASRQRDHLARVFQIAHDMKGQGSTFGYPLITEIANRLCRAIEADPDPASAALDRFALLVAALREIVETRLEGDGAEAGRRLLADLVPSGADGGPT